MNSLIFDPLSPVIPILELLEYHIITTVLGATVCVSVILAFGLKLQYNSLLKQIALKENEDIIQAIDDFKTNTE